MRFDSRPRSARSELRASMRPARFSGPRNSAPPARLPFESGSRSGPIVASILLRLPRLFAYAVAAAALYSAARAILAHVL